MDVITYASSEMTLMQWLLLPIGLILIGLGIVLIVKRAKNKPNKPS